jgi:hypothetical protein
VALGVWSRVQGLVFGGAIGSAFSRAVEPILEPVRQRAWSKNPVRVLSVGDLAELVAKGLTSLASVVDDAERTGHDADNLRALTALRQTYPGLGELDEMSNRGVLAPGLVDKALSRHGIPAEYHAAVKALFSDLLDPAALAAAVHRNIVPDPGFLVGEQPGTDRKVPIFPKVGIDVTKEYLGQGLDEKRFRTLVGLQGLPMGPHEAAQAKFRGIITHDDYLAAIAQGNTRNEWSEAILEQTRQIPTSRDFFENALRGYHDLAWAQEQAERHGMSPEDSLVIYQNQGRPMNVRNITQALARGGTFEPEPGEMTDDALRTIIRDFLPPGDYDLNALRPYMASIVEGSLKPAYYDLEYARRYNYPSAFVFRTLQGTHAINRDQAAQYYKELGWPPELAEQAATAFAKQGASAEKEASATDLLTLWDGGRATAAETLAALEDLGYPADEAQRKMDTLAARRVSSARTTAISDLHGAFKKGDIDGATALGALADLGVPDWAQNQIVVSWAIAYGALTARLTESRIRADYEAGRITLEEAIGRLGELGHNEEEAIALLGVQQLGARREAVRADFQAGRITLAAAIDALGALGFGQMSSLDFLGVQDAAARQSAIRADYQAGRIGLAAAIGALGVLGMSRNDALAFLGV